MIFLHPLYENPKGKIVFIHPLGFCANFVDYDPAKYFDLKIFYNDEKKNITYPAIFEKMEVFLTDSSKLTYSSIDLQSHQGNHIFGIKQNCKSIYNVQYAIKDFDNPEERKSCSKYTKSSYDTCVDDQTQDIVTKVLLDYIKIY